jgi:hypothetical protein
MWVEDKGFQCNVLTRGFPMIRLLTVFFLVFTSIVAQGDEAGQATLSFVRPFDPMTVAQNVKLKIGKNEVAKLSVGESFQTTISPGKYTLQTSVGWSLGVPNVTGYNGARKFKKIYPLSSGERFFKIHFKPSLMGGKHEIIEITGDAFGSLVESDSVETQ